MLMESEEEGENGRIGKNGRVFRYKLETNLY